MSCPFPDKIKYPSRTAANKALRHMPWRQANGNSPYRCKGHWHIGRDAWRRIDRLVPVPSDPPEDQ